MISSQVLLHLTLTEGIGPTLINKILLQLAEKEFPELYTFTTQDFIELGVSRGQAEKIIAGLKNLSVLDDELKLIEKHNVNIISIFDDHYPNLLKNIHYYPPILYLWGSGFNENAHHIAMVGSRNASRYCINVLDRLLPPLTNQGWVTVSGGARGADSMVHEKTMEYGGSTVVVLGSGLLEIYPREHTSLFNRVIEGDGTILSVFPLRTRPSQHTFPARNRIISGLSSGTIVLQAAQRSGALITAQFALEQGREVFAVPGPLDNELSAGPHSLIKQGAQLVTSADDIFEAFHFCSAYQQQTIQENKQITITEQQKMLVEQCNEPRSIDDLVIQSNIDYEQVHEMLFNLQIIGLVMQNHAGLWQNC